MTLDKKTTTSVYTDEYLSLITLIGEPTRLQILLLLIKHKELNGKSIQEQLSISTQTKTARHLGYLYRVGIVSKRTGVKDIFTHNQTMFSIASYYKPSILHILSPIL